MGSGGRSGSTSQTGPVSLSPTGSGHVWTDTQANCPCHDPSSRTGQSVPWQQQLVKNVSVSGLGEKWSTRQAQGAWWGAALLSYCRLCPPSVVTQRHTPPLTQSHPAAQTHLGMPLSAPAPTGTHLTLQSTQPAHTTPYPQVLLGRRGMGSPGKWGPRSAKLNIAPVSLPPISVPIPRAAGLSAHLDSRLTGLGRRPVF